MKVLFIGGKGIISEGVSRLAIEKGFDLYLLNRGNRNLYIPEGAKVINGDIRDYNTVKEVLKPYSFDVVVDWIAFTPDHIRSDLQLVAGNVVQ